MSAKNEGWNLSVRQVKFEDLSRIGRDMRRAGLSYKPTKNTEWYGLFLDDELVGASGLIRVNAAGTEWRLKSAYIQPEWRGLGGYKLLTDVRMERAWELGAEWVCTITRHRHIFQKLGFEQYPARSASHMRMARPQA